MKNEKRRWGEGKKYIKRRYSSGAIFVRFGISLHFLDGRAQVLDEFRTSPDMFSGDANV
jgi:hypothetical protein